MGDIVKSNKPYFLLSEFQIKSWLIISIIEFLTYEMLWLPTLITDNDRSLRTVFAGMSVDIVVCILISAFDCVVVKFIRRHIQPDKLSIRHVVAIIALIFFLNFVFAFPITIIDYHIYNLMYESDFWDWSDNILDSYILAVTASLIATAWLLMWLADAVRRKDSLIAEARFSLLKNQLNPHFFFNSISIGIGLIGMNPQKAIDYFLKMSKTMRNMLYKSMQQTVALNTETTDLQPYLDMLETRYGNGLRIRWNISESDNRLLILSGTLHLLIENIVKHNYLSERNPLTVDISVSGNTLIVSNEIRNRETETESFGLGMKILKEGYGEFGKKSVRMEKKDNRFISYIPLLRNEDTYN